MSLELHNINKTYGGFSALRNINLTVRDGDMVALLGPSGSGKTTLLRIIAGLDHPDPGSGPILLNGKDVAGSNVRNRRVGFVFQHYALFRNMTVFENIAFGLRVRPRKSRPRGSEIRERVQRLLSLIQMSGMAERYPAQLSGGQRQRVALARALAVEPSVLLLDEPFGALDAKVRTELRRWLRRFHDEMHITSVFVTHDQDEALEVADNIAVINKGHMEQFGAPDEVFHHPASRFVMNFLGNVNIFHGRVEAGKAYFGSMEIDHREENVSPGGEIEMFVRPEHVIINNKTPAEPAMRATVTRINIAGSQVKVELVSETGENLNALMPHERFNELELAKNDTVFVNFLQSRVYVEDYNI